MVKAPPGTPDESDGIIRDLKRQIAELRAKLDEANADAHHWKANYNGLLEIAEEARLGEEIRTYERDEVRDQRDAAEAENARLKALPLKDEVERVLEEVRDNGLIYWEPNTARGQDRKTAVVERLNALLSRLRAGVQEGWRPISDAPKDGENILYITKFKDIGFCHWDEGYNDDDYPCWWDNESDAEVYPIAWLPADRLPASPSVSEGGSRNG